MCIREEKKTAHILKSKARMKDNKLCCIFSRDNSQNNKEVRNIFLCKEFMKISRRLRYTPEKLKDLPSYVKEGFRTDAQEIICSIKNIALQETLYYVCDWTINATKK